MQRYQPLVPAREEFVKVRGLDCRVLHWGPADARPVFLLHGFQDCADTFQFLVDALPRGLRFVAPDWRGFGGSERNDSPYWFPDYLADLETLLDHYGDGGPATLVGHSMGGNIAGLYAGVRSARIGRLVSLEGFGLPRVDIERAPDHVARWLDQLRKGVEESRYESSARLANSLQRRNPRLPAAVAAFVAEAWTRPIGDGAVMLRFDPWHRLVNAVQYRRDEAEACWRRVQAPTLLLLGGQSEFRRHLEQNDGVDEVARFRACFRRLEVHDFPALGHMLHHEDPTAVAAVIADWLGRHA
jgi:pimeloyl-ACP methyl ester carboxylesterase